MKTITITLEQLKKHNPCQSALDFIEQCGSLKEAWNKCEKSDWMLFLLKHENLLSKRDSVRLSIAFAEHVLVLFETRYQDDKRPRKAIQAAKNWLKKPSEKNRLICEKAYASANAAAAVAYDAAYAVAYYAAYYAATAANAAAAVAYDAADATEKKMAM